MIPLQNDRLIRTIWHEPVDRTPIWIMRQAGRYLPEYRKVREKAGSFIKLCKTPELACEVTLQPIQRFPLDAAIIFSDILTIPDAMGLGLQVKEGEGVFFERPLQNPKDIQNLFVPEPETHLNYVLDAIKMVTHELAQKIPLIGFSGSPWTLASYMIEGRSTKDFSRIQQMLQEDSNLLHQLLDVLAQSVSIYLKAQIRAGVSAVMIFDTWGGMLDIKNYEIYSTFYIKKIIAQLALEQSAGIPVILFTKDSQKRLDLMAETGANALSVDSNTNLSHARRQLGDKVALQGNMNPQILLETPAKIQEEAARVLAEFGSGSGHVFNLGHGITPDVPPEHVAELVRAVHTLSNRYHE